MVSTAVIDTALRESLVGDTSTAKVNVVAREILVSETCAAKVDTTIREVLYAGISTAAIDRVAREVLISTNNDLHDNLSISDGFTVTASFLADFSDTLAASETFAGGYVVSQSDLEPVTDTFTAVVDFSAALSDTENITDDDTARADFAAAVSDTEPVSDIIDVLPTGGIFDDITAETLLADTTVMSSLDAMASETLLAELCTASFDAVTVETLLLSFVRVSIIDNNMIASDEFNAKVTKAPLPPPPPPPVLSTNIPSAKTQQPYTPVSTNMTDWQGWNQQMARTINGVLAGGTNTTIAEFTLSVNSTTTILYASQIGATSVITLTPITESAAGEKTWITDQKSGQATINHSSAATTDRTFRVQIVA